MSAFFPRKLQEYMYFPKYSGIYLIYLIEQSALVVQLHNFWDLQLVFFFYQKKIKVIEGEK